MLRLSALAVVSALVSCAGPSGSLSIVAHEDRVAVFVGDQLFTEYRFAGDQKYPYFYPVNGPYSEQSLTTESSEPYPHHHSLFFGCDRVNGGNYWQQGHGRGQIRQRELKIEQPHGERVSFVTENEWARPDAPAPFADRRRVTITAPRDDLRLLDFEITLTALVDVSILRTNHALFSARVVDELSVKAGGVMVNAEGARGEKATFGQPSPWMDYSGQRLRGAPIEGIAILVHPQNRWSPCRWFTRDYGFFSPTPMHWLPGGKLEIGRGESLTLRYRVAVHVGDAEHAGIGKLYDDYQKTEAR